MHVLKVYKVGYVAIKENNHKNRGQDVPEDLRYCLTF